jgi:hypothetical protein
VQGLRSEEAEGKQPGLLTPEPHPSPGPAIATLPFVLDALARRAGFGDAEHVGRAATAWFDWLPVDAQARAAEWADFGEVSQAIPVSALFARHPAAPSRIAALVRAGLARLSDAHPSLPPPAARPPAIAAPRSIPAHQREAGSIAPPPLSAPTPLDPGQARVAERLLNIEPVANWFPVPSGALNDPLDPFEREIARLEQSGAPPQERSAAWLALADAWLREHDSPEEAARACREAAAADPENTIALSRAADLSASMGRPDLGYAYALEAAAHCQDPLDRAQLLVRASDYGLRGAKGPSALRALRKARTATPEDPIVGERYARLLATRGDTGFAAKAARAAAEQYRRVRPEAGRALLAWAFELASNNAELAVDFASSLMADGFGEAGVAVLARAARSSGDLETRRRLLSNAATRAELIARPDLSAELLLEAVDRDGFDIAQALSPLLSSIEAQGHTVELSVIAHDLAARTQGPARAACLLKAGQARLELPGDPLDALELFTQALLAEPRAERTLELIAQFANESRDARRLTDSYERALRTDGLDRHTVLALARRLITLAAGPLDAPFIERWAWALSARFGGPSPTSDMQHAFEARLAQSEADIRQAELELRHARPDERAHKALIAADLMRDDPARRPLARKIYEKLLEQDPRDEAVRTRLVLLLRLEGDKRALCALEAQRVHIAETTLEKISAELAWIRAERDLGNLEGATQATLSLLAHTPKNREALTWLERLAEASENSSLLRDAQARRAEAALDPRDRARCLAALARSCLDAGDTQEAIARAEAALAADPRCADAALLLLDKAPDLERGRAVGNLRAARAVLGDSAQLLSALSRACFGTRDAVGQLEALEAYARLCPLDPVPALGLVAIRSTGKDPRALRDALERALTAECFTDATPETALSALERLFQLGRVDDAVELVVKSSDRLGERVDLLVDWAMPLLDQVENPRLALSLLERVSARAVGEEKQQRLRALSRFHRERGERAAEARVYLRLLALEPADAEALERLSMIYASGGEIERLMSVLTLRLDIARSDVEHRERMIELALGSLSLSDDPSTAQELLRSALSSERADERISDPPPELLQRGIGILLGSDQPHLGFDLLLELSDGASPSRSAQMIEEAIYIAETHLHDHDLALRAATVGLESHPLHIAFLLQFERLALEVGDVATGREVYHHLAEAAMGIHGRRAVLYRGARWLERAGAIQDALSMTEEAFRLAPTEGAVFGCLERLGRTLGQHSVIVEALLALAADDSQPRDRAGLLLRAGTLCEDELHDLERACALYLRSYQERQDADVMRRALSAIASLGQRDEHAAARAREAVREALDAAAQQAWAAEPRVTALLHKAVLEQQAGTGREQIDALLRDARHCIDADEMLDDAAKARLLASLEEAFPTPSAMKANGSPAAGAQQAVAHPATATPTVEAQPTAELMSLAEGHAAPARRARTVTDPGIAPVAQVSQSTLDMRTTQRDFPGVPRNVLADARARIEESAARVQAQASETRSLEPAAAPRVDERTDGEAATLARLLDEGGSDPAWAASMMDSLLSRVRAGKASYAVVKALKTVAIRCERHSVAQVSTEALAHIEAEQPAHAGHALDPNDESVKVALLDARDDGALSPVFTILAHVHQGAGPLFRRPLSAFNVSANDFVPPLQNDPWGNTLRTLNALLGVEHEAYLRHGEGDLLTLAATQPAAILFGDRTTKDELALRFRVARMFEFARPGSLLLATLPGERASSVLSAIIAAFGPTDPNSPPVAREAASLAAELWRTMPSATQRQVSNLFRGLSLLPSYDQLSRALQLRAARVGLVACGALDVAISNLHCDSAGEPIARSEQGFDAALTHGSVLGPLLSFAFSDHYLHMREATGG